MRNGVGGVSSTPANRNGYHLGMTHGWTRYIVLLGGLLLASVATASGVPPIRAAAGAGHGWLVRQTGEQYEVYHHAPGDSWLQWQRTMVDMLWFPERVAATSSSMHEGSVAMAFPAVDRPGTRAVRTRRAVFHAGANRWLYLPGDRFQIEAGLPGDSDLSGLVYRDGIQYALLTGRSAVRRDAAAESEQVERAEAEEVIVRPTVGPATRLLRLEGRAWVEVALPTGLELTASGMRLVSLPDGVAILAPDATDASSSVLHRLSVDGDWAEQRLPISLDRLHDVTTSEGQIVATLYSGEDGEPMSESGGADAPPSLDVVLVRPQHALTLASVAVSPSDTVLLASGADAILITHRDDGLPVIRVIEMSTGRERELGELREPPILTPDNLRPLELVAVLLLLAIATIMSKPDPSNAAVAALAGSLKPADLPVRLLAFAIDLAPVVFILSLVTSTGIMEVIGSLPMLTVLSVRAEQLPMALMMTALAVFHGGVCEAIWGRSLGKMVVGCRIVNLQGGRPSLWQFVVRALLKWVVCLFPIVLLVAVFSPTRQHLGDLAARVVVVTPLSAAGPGRDN
jgi:uncharacterized RDD family membrane protein YckC